VCRSTTPHSPRSWPRLRRRPPRPDADWSRRRFRTSTNEHLRLVAARLPRVLVAWRSLRRKRVWVPVAVTGTLLLGATARLFVWPSTNDAHRADVVVVLDGGSGERLEKARALMARHVAPTLAISTGRELDPDEADGLCARPQPFEVVCFSPKPASTRGEARALATLARRNGWNRAVLVTSTYHVTRARMLVERCYDGRVDVVAASPPTRPLHWVAALGHEWAALLAATLRWSC
jgi:uncharacterized SAM-binding protein YcdF (DUF218 family)